VGEGVGVGLLLSMLVLFYCATTLLATNTAEAGSSSSIFVFSGVISEYGLLWIDWLFGVFDILSLEFGVGGKGVGFDEFAGWVHVAMLRGEIMVGRIKVG
jgi:hypothetical protein